MAQPQLTVMDEETRAYQEVVARIRFRQNLIHGIGAATVFGIATAIAGFLFGVVAEVGFLSLAGAAAGLGVVGLVVAGIGFLSMSSKLASQLVRIEQDHHAKEIAKGITAATPVIEQRPVPFASQDKAASGLETATKDAPVIGVNNVSNVALQGKAEPAAALNNARAS